MTYFEYIDFDKTGKNNFKNLKYYILLLKLL